MYRKIFCALVMVISVLYTAHPAQATSGACSGHDGVNCAAGSDSDGSVICFDGWRNSSVRYSSMVMCQGYTFVPVASEPERPVAVPVAPFASEPEVSVSPTESAAEKEEVAVTNTTSTSMVSPPSVVESDTLGSVRDSAVDGSPSTEVPNGQEQANTFVDVTSIDEVDALSEEVSETEVEEPASSEPTESSAAAGVVVLAGLGGLGYGTYRGLKKVVGMFR